MFIGNIMLDKKNCTGKWIIYIGYTDLLKKFKILLDLLRYFVPNPKIDNIQLDASNYFTVIIKNPKKIHWDS